MRPGRAEIERRLAEEIALRIRRPAETLDRLAPLRGFGLDSVEGAQIAGALQDWLGVALPPTLLWDHGTIAAAADAVTAAASGR